jgi:hypothetical protein
LDVLAGFGCNPVFTVKLFLPCLAGRFERESSRGLAICDSLLFCHCITSNPVKLFALIQSRDFDLFEGKKNGGISIPFYFLNT